MLGCLCISLELGAGKLCGACSPWRAERLSTACTFAGGIQQFWMKLDSPWHKSRGLPRKGRAVPRKPPVVPLVQGDEFRVVRGISCPEVAIVRADARVI